MPERSLTGGEVTNVGYGDYKTTFDLEEPGDYVVIFRATSPVGENIGTRVKIKANPL